MKYIFPIVAMLIIYFLCVAAIVNAKPPHQQQDLSAIEDRLLVLESKVLELEAVDQAQQDEIAILQNQMYSVQGDVFNLKQHEHDVPEHSHFDCGDIL